MPKYLSNGIGILTTKHLLPDSKKVYNCLFSKEKTVLTTMGHQDIYFELKVVK